LGNTIMYLLASLQLARPFRPTDKNERFRMLDSEFCEGPSANSRRVLGTVTSCVPLLSLEMERTSSSRSQRV